MCDQQGSEQRVYAHSLIRTFASCLNIVGVTEHHLEFLRLKGGFTG